MHVGGFLFTYSTLSVYYTFKFLLSCGIYFGVIPICVLYFHNPCKPRDSTCEVVTLSHCLVVVAYVPLLPIIVACFASCVPVRGLGLWKYFSPEVRLVLTKISSLDHIWCQISVFTHGGPLSHMHCLMRVQLHDTFHNVCFLVMSFFIHSFVSIS